MTYALALLILVVEGLDVVRQLLDDLPLLAERQQVLRSWTPAELVQLLLLHLSHDSSLKSVDVEAVVRNTLPTGAQKDNLKHYSFTYPHYYFYCQYYKGYSNAIKI